MVKKLVIGLVVLLVVAGGLYLVLHKRGSTGQTASTSSSPASPASSAPVAATITYTSAGFSPGSTTVKSGDTVAIKNSSSSDLQLDSNPHPMHTDDTDLNVGLVAPGQTKTFTVTQRGTFGFHNHLNPGDTATITIQ